MDSYFIKQLLISLIIYTGQALLGYAMGWTAPIVPKLQDPSQTPLPYVISDQQASWIASVIYIGTLFVPFVSVYLTNVIGRKPCLFIGGIFTMIGFLLLAVAQNLAMIYAGRILAGLGTGIIATINFVYLGEIASTNVRGIFLTGAGIAGTVGTLMVYSVGPFAPYVVTNWVGVALTALYMAGLFLIPETPIFYILKGKDIQAIDTLIALGRKNEIEQLVNTKTKKDEPESKWTELFTVKSNRMAFIITLTLGILQQLSGITVVIFFMTTIFEMAGSSIQPNIATIILGGTQMFASFITPFFVERTGRKLILLVSSASCCLSVGTLGIYFFLDHQESAIIESIKWLPLVILIVFFFSYAAGFGIIPGTLIGELFHPTVRSLGSTITVTVPWLFGFGVSTAFGYMLAGIGAHFAFWIFSAACAVAFVFTVVLVPETKGKSILEIQEMLS